MKWFERLYLGTWQFGGQFKKLSPAYIESLLIFAISSGIRRFDTAAVYGKGKVEEILGKCLPKDAVIVTKIPAASKPSLESPAPIMEFYSLDDIRRSVYESLSRLGRGSIDTILLHNWLPAWSSDAIIILELLNSFKNEGVVSKVGISLPDNFFSNIDETVIPYLDVIEAPFNSRQMWILQQLPQLLALNKEILLRSLFCQGELLTGQESADMIVQKTIKLGTSMVIGMTTEEQVTNNIATLKGATK